jgi:hypothetical protein
LYRVVEINQAHGKENAMQQFIEKYREQIRGVLSGFDRLVFRGSLRRLNASFLDPTRQVIVAKGMEEYCWQNQVLFKHYADHVRRVSEKLKIRSLQPYRDGGIPIQYLRDNSVDKDQLARQIANSQGVRSGAVCAISALEPSPTFDYVKSRLVRRTRPCHVLYHYQMHPELGWMYARIQTWFPFNIQIGVNGREWLGRQMDREGLRYQQQENCFPWIEDYTRAQQCLDRQLETNWAELLQSFVPQLNPAHEEIFARYPADYYWTCYQSEWATDIVFREADYLKRLMSFPTPHGMLSFSSADVLRYFGKRVNQSGKIPANFNGQLQTNLKQYREGERVKYWMNGNSTKFYDKAYTDRGSVLRAAETTTNNVSVFRSYRPKEGGPEEDLQWRQMRKGVADLKRRAEISQNVNERLVNALASVDDSRRLEELVAPLQQRVNWKGRRVRALRPWAEDKELLAAVNHGDFLINGFRNRDLQALLYDDPAKSDHEKRRRCAAISRKLRMLRAHGIIRKVPHTHRYHVAPEARTTLVAILTATRTTLHQINELKRKAA